MEINELTNIDDKRACWKILDSLYEDVTKRIPNYFNYKQKVCQYADFYGAVDEGEICGFIAFYANDNESAIAYITQIAVNPMYQHRGIGRKLLLECETRAIKNGMNLLRLEVRKNNANAIRFYESYGFEKETQEKDNSFYMRKQLI